MPTSIITSMYNRKPATIETVDNLFFPSILNNASSDKELVILDDCSPLEQETRAMVEKYLRDLKKRFGNVVFERNPENYGFGKSFNRGINLAGGDRLVVSNDDVYFPLESVDLLAATLLESDKFGLIAPITNEKTSWTYQYCKQAPKLKSYSPEELEKLESFAKHARESMKGIRIAVDNVSGFCFAINSDLLREIGTFDESFEYGLFEDTDLAKRVGQEYKIIINPEVFVNHGGLKGASGSLLQQPIKTSYYAVVNAFKHGRKWSYLNTLRGIAFGLYSQTGRGTVSELFEEKWNQ